MPVPKPSDVPRWADGGTGTPTNVVDPPEHNGSISAWAAGDYAVATFVGKGGNYYIVTSISGTGTSTTGPTGTGSTTDNPGPNQVVWGWVTTTPVTKDSGWLPGQQPPAQWFNWLFYTINLWILWLQDIANQSFNGGGVGPWTGEHLFTGGHPGFGNSPLTVTAGISTSGGDIDAIYAAGSGAGSGVQGVGGPSGLGGLFVGGASSAYGAQCQAGAGSNGAGCYHQGDGAGPGAACYGGTGGGAGALGYGQGSATGLGGSSGSSTMGGVTGANTGAGPGVLGTSSTGIGGQFTGGTNNTGCEGIGTGLGNGVSGVGGSGGNAGVLGAGYTGTNGGGVKGVGQGTGPGVEGVSDGASYGVKGTGGGSAPGVAGFGGSGGGSGAKGTPGTGSTVAFEAWGGLEFQGTPPTKTADCGTDQYFGPHIPKVNGNVTTDGAGAIAFNGVGIGSAGITIPDPTEIIIQVTFSHAMADTTYGITYGSAATSSTALTCPATIPGSKTIHGFQFAVFTAGGSLLPASVALEASFVVSGRHV